MKRQRFNLGCLVIKTVTCPVIAFFALTTPFMGEMLECNKLLTFGS
jgi:hypothetical protein